MKKPLKPKYSGDASKPFWDRVHAMPWSRKEAAYVMGCILQDTEARVLRFLNEKENRK